jgi:hypothetical protein
MFIHPSRLLVLASAAILTTAPSVTAATLGPAPFTIVTLPDTQNLSDNDLYNLPVTGLPAALVGTRPGQEALPPNRITLFNAQTQWVAANQASQNIQFLAHLGDITQDATPPEFGRVAPVFARLDAIGPNFAYSTVPGTMTTSQMALAKLRILPRRSRWQSMRRSLDLLGMRVAPGTGVLAQMLPIPISSSRAAIGPICTSGWNTTQTTFSTTKNQLSGPKACSTRILAFPPSSRLTR